MGGNHSREKGKRWEKRVLAWFESVGYRAQRLLGRAGEPDIRVEVPDGWCLYVEAKHHKRVNLRAAVKQAQAGSRGPSDHWAVCAKDDRADEIWIFPKALAEHMLAGLQHLPMRETCESSNSGNG